MKKLIAATLLLCLGFLKAFAFDWKPQSNEELFNSMIEYARTAQKELADVPKASKLLSSFIVKQETAYGTDPYAWIGATYKLTYALQKLYPACINGDDVATRVRMHAYRLLDFPIHVDQKGPGATEEENRAWTVGRNRNWEQGCKRVLATLAKTTPAEGELQVLKVYNMGYVFRTSKHCFAIDLCWRGSKADAMKLCRYIDVLFITHPHGDHYTDVMLEAVLESGKTLVLSKDYGPEAADGNKIVMWEDRLKPVDMDGLKVCTFKGNQNKKEPEKMPNNVYHIQFDGWTILHHGDNSDHKRDGQLKKLAAPDVVIAATWNKPKHLMDAVRTCPDASEHSTVFISSHENEYGHRVQQRESYWETFTRSDRYGDPEYDYFPWMTMEAGESFTFTKAMIKK